MFDIFNSRLEVKGDLVTVTALRISAGRSVEPIGSDLPVVKDALGRPLIPGSSFKGAMRSRLESFLRGVDARFAIDPSELVETRQMNRIKQIKQDHEKRPDAELTEVLRKQTDLVSRLFGSPWMAGKLQVRDLTVDPDFWFDQYMERDGVAIDRDTETAAEGKLYDFQIVPAEAHFTFQAVVENAEPWELGLFMIGLHQFKTEQIPLGGGRSRGLGVVRLEIKGMKWFDRQNQPGRMLEYLKKLTSNNPDSAYEDVSEDKRNEWVQHLISYLESELANPTDLVIN